MNIISEHIEYLLLGHDCVIVPGWGAFIAQYQAAKFSDDGLMLPPSRVIGFNSSVSHQDGLLASSLMRREKICYEVALSKIDDDVNAMKHQLDVEGELAVGHIGVFSKSDTGELLFEPHNTASVSGEFLSLMPVEVVAPRVDVEPEKPRRKDVIYVPVSRNFISVAASFLLLLVLGFTLTTPVILDDNASYASISTPKVTAPTKVKQPVVSEPPVDAELFIALPAANADGITIVDTTKVNERDNHTNCPTLVSLRCEDNDPYCLIVASLASEELALEYIAERNDETLHILATGDKFRVYAATGATFSQALAPTKNLSFSDKYPAAWVCRR